VHRSRIREHFRNHEVTLQHVIAVAFLRDELENRRCVGNAVRKLVAAVARWSATLYAIAEKCSTEWACVRCGSASLAASGNASCSTFAAASYCF